MSLSIENLKKHLLIDYLIPKFVFHISKNLVMIRPKKPSDAYTEKFSFPAAELVKTKAVSEGWTVTDLQGNNTNRSNVTTTINTAKPDFVVHYDHGSQFTLWGQKANVLEAAIDSANVSLLSERAASTVSCESAAGLGPLAIVSTSRAYLGYDALHWVHLWYLDKFTEAANAANYALLEGKTFSDAYTIGWNKYTEKYNELLLIPDTGAAALMLHDRNHLVRLGNASAKATGFYFHIIH